MYIYFPIICYVAAFSNLFPVLPLCTFYEIFVLMTGIFWNRWLMRTSIKLGMGISLDENSVHKIMGVTESKRILASMALNS